MSRRFGEIRQNGYVVRDIESAMEHWVTVLGVGPWFYLEHAPIQDFCYYGEPSDLSVSIALANSGPLQIELIQQRNDAPTMYRDFLGAGREGLQHLAYWTTDFDADLDRLLGEGLEVGQSGHVGGADGRFVYFAIEAHPGTVIELSEISGTKGKFFQHIRESARSWDGTTPIHRLSRNPTPDSKHRPSGASAD